MAETIGRSVDKDLLAQQGVPTEQPNPHTIDNGEASCTAYEQWSNATTPCCDTIH